MRIVHDFMSGFLSVVKVTASPMLYRHPYRISAEGLRADWMSIGRDIDSVMGRLQSEAGDGQRAED